MDYIRHYIIVLDRFVSSIDVILLKSDQTINFKLFYNRLFR